MKIKEIKAISMEGEGAYFSDVGEESQRKSEDTSLNEILEKSKDFIIGGLASTSIIDLENEQITRKALKKIWEHLQSLDSEYRNVFAGHDSTQIGTVLLEYKNHKSALLNEGLYLICKIRQDIPIALDTIKKIKQNELNSFSIKIGIPQPLSKNIKTVCDKDQCWSELRAGYFLEVSLTDSPANPDCEGDVKILS